MNDIRITMTMESMDGEESAKVSTMTNEEDEYIPEIVSGLAQRLMKGYGIPDDAADDIQSIGWERFAKEHPYQGGVYLISIPDGEFVKTTTDYWDTEKQCWADHNNDQIIFWAALPASPAFWSNGG